MFEASYWSVLSLFEQPEGSWTQLELPDENYS